MANVLPNEKRLRVLAPLVDGNSIRAAARMTGVHPDTIGRFALTMGAGCDRLHNRMVREMSCSLIQVDEIWSYIKKKEARVTPEDGPDVGEAYTFTALDASSRMVLAYYVGKRNQESADIFVKDLRARLTVMPQITSDGFAPYVSSILESFGLSVNYGQTIKNYRVGGRREGGDDHRYEPPRDPFITKKVVYGAPDMARASTSYMERQNLTTRHFTGRMRRLCLAFSKKLESHRAAMALNYVHYNFCHVIKTLRVTPAMQAGVTTHVWTLEEFMEEVLTGAPADPPIAVPLRHLAPPGNARALPNGRGFLRVVDGGGAPVPVPPTPASPAMAVSSMAGPAPSPPAAMPAPAPSEGQLDLLAWRPKPKPMGQLSLFE